MDWLLYIALALLALIIVSVWVEVWRFKQDIRRRGLEIDTRKRR